MEPWEHGTVARSASFPTFYDYNVVRVEEPDPGMSADDLIVAGDRHLDGLKHRRFDVDDETAGARLRPRFRELGFRTTRLMWLRWDAAIPGDAPPVEQVDPEEARTLRWEWAVDDTWAPSEEDARKFLGTEVDVYARRGGRWFVRRGPDGTPIAFVLLLIQDGGAEISLAYCTPEHRGAGIGTSLLLSAVAEAADAEEIWIVADDEDRPKSLYRRLGFAPAWISHEFTLIPRP
jgi:GNAT superfamily N-acetyltransferase